MLKKLSKRIAIFFTICAISITNINLTNAEASQMTEVPTTLVTSILNNYISENNSSLSNEEINNLSQSIIYYSYQYGLDPLVTASLISAESTFHQSAISSVGAVGLGQIMPSTALSLGVNPYNSNENIEGTCSYLSTQIKNFSNSNTPVEFALAAYNAGPGAVKKYGGIPPYAETQNYVNNIKNKYFSLYNKLTSSLKSNNSSLLSNKENNKNNSSYDITSYSSYIEPEVIDSGYDVSYDNDDDFSF